MSLKKFFCKFFSRTSSTAPAVDVVTAAVQAVETPSFLLPETAARFISDVRSEVERRATHNVGLEIEAQAIEAEAQAIEAEAGSSLPAKAELLRRKARVEHAGAWEKRREKLNLELLRCQAEEIEKSARAWERERILSEGVVIHSNTATPPFEVGAVSMDCSAWDATRRLIVRFGGRYFLATKVAKMEVTVLRSWEEHGGTAWGNMTMRFSSYTPTGVYEEWQTRFITESLQQFTATELATVAADEAARV